ncbi:MAG: hypothetical protein RMJ88_09465 [Thermogemmata sp.]|nr:hypothetical protein [Thermogemmata sp.]
MMLKWNPTISVEDLRQAIGAAAAAGAPVVLPGDCGYVAVLPFHSPRLEAWCSRLPERPALWVAEADQLRQWGFPPPISLERLFRRGWPLPLLALVPMPEQPTGPSGQRSGWQWACDAEGRLRLRHPEHPLTAEIAERLDLSAWLVADTFVPTVEAALDMLDDAEAMGVSVGALPVEPRPSQVVFGPHDWQMVVEGAVTPDELAPLTARLIVFVCTGNTCRSPLAEGLTKMLAAARLGCSVEELPRRGLWITSAGLGTSGGWPASAEAVQVAAEHGVDLSTHRSRSLHPWLLAAADEVITMTQGHSDALQTHYPGLGPPPRLLCAQADVPDPIGAGLDVYRACAAMLRQQVEQLLAEWLPS